MLAMDIRKPFPGCGYGPQWQKTFSIRPARLTVGQSRRPAKELVVAIAVLVWVRGTGHRFRGSEEPHFLHGDERIGIIDPVDLLNLLALDLADDGHQFAGSVDPR